MLLSVRSQPCAVDNLARLVAVLVQGCRNLTGVWLCFGTVTSCRILQFLSSNLLSMMRALFAIWCTCQALVTKYPAPCQRQTTTSPASPAGCTSSQQSALILPAIHKSKAQLRHSHGTMVQLDEIPCAVLSVSQVFETLFYWCPNMDKGARKALLNTCFNFIPQRLLGQFLASHGSKDGLSSWNGDFLYADPDVLAQCKVCMVRRSGVHRC